MEFLEIKVCILFLIIIIYLTHSNNLKFKEENFDSAPSTTPTPQTFSSLNSAAISALASVYGPDGGPVIFNQLGVVGQLTVNNLITNLQNATLTGTMSVVNGGTGLNTLPSSCLLLGNGTNSISGIPNTSVASVLAIGGVGGTPVWSDSPTINQLKLNTLIANSNVITSSPLVISGSNPTNIGAYGWFNKTGKSGTNTAAGGNGLSMAVYAPGGRICAQEFDAVSSIKIKNIENQNNDFTNEVMSLFSNIHLYKYTYIDKIKNGNGIYYGLIAEDLKKILPQYVN